MVLGARAISLAKKIRAKLQSHPTHSEMERWAREAEKLERKIEEQQAQIEALAKRLHLDLFEEVKGAGKEVVDL